MGKQSARANGVAEPSDCQPPASDRPADVRRLDTGTNPLLLGNGKGLALAFLGGACGVLVGSCGRPELTRRDADEALEMAGELALVREAGLRGDVRQGQAAVSEQFLGSLDSAGDDVLVRRQPRGRLELPREVVRAEAGDSGQLLQARAP